MKRSIVLALAAGVLLATAGTAAAAQSKPSKRIVRLEKAVHTLRSQVADMKHQRNEALLQLAAAQRQVTVLTGQVTVLTRQNASLQASVAKLTTDRDAARAQTAAAQAQANALRAQIAAIPTPLAVAVEQVRREVAYAERYDGGVPYSHGQLVAQAAMDYVVEHVSPTAYGYLEIFGGQLPGSSPNAALGAQAGLCGNAALVFAAIVKRLGLGARSVQFYYDDPGNVPDNHIAVEVSYDGGWHYFDPTFGVFWTDAPASVLSITDVLAGSGTQQKDALGFTNLVENTFYGDDTWFVTDPATTVVIDGQPFSG